MEERKGGRADAGRKAIERQNRGRRLPLERVTSREIGLKQGTENPNLKLLPEEAWDDGLRQTAKRLEQETGRGVTYVLGGMEIEDADGETHTVRGVITQEQIIIQADCMSATAEQIGEHELFHYYADENPGLISSVREEIIEKYGREEFDEIVGRYIERLRGIIDVSESPFADVQDAVLEDIENEIFADAYAGINAFGAHAERYQGDVRSVTEERGVTSRQTSEATERRTGPPEKHSVEEVDGKKYVRADRQVIFGNDPRAWSGQLEDYINGKIRRGQDVTLIGADGDELKLTAATAGKISSIYKDGKQLSDDYLSRKFSAGAHIDELVETSRGFRNVNDEGGVHSSEADRGWNYRRAYFMDFDSTYYECTISVEKGSNGNVVYNVGQMKRRPFPTAPKTALNGSSAESGARREERSPGSKVSQSTPPVKQRFSMDEPVERTDTLLALHNMTEEKLRRTLELGAWPSPSIAIVEAEQGHAQYGEYSAVFPASVIDPQTDKRNRIYGSDAWTPTDANARVEYEVDYDAKREFERNIEDLSGSVANGIFSQSSVLDMAGVKDWTEKSQQEIAERLANRYDSVRAAYLADHGRDVDVVYKTKEFDSWFGNDALKKYIDKVGPQQLAELYVKLETGERLTAYETMTAENAIREAYEEKHASGLNRRPEKKAARIADYMENNVTSSRIEDFIRNAWELYQSGGGADEVDRMKTAENLRREADSKAVEAWVLDMLKGVQGKPGIYNGEDVVTDGGRRSFAQTHWEYNVENIVRAMNSADARGAGLYGVTGTTLAATATPEYRSIADVHADEGRLRKLDQGEYDRKIEDLSIELDRVTDSLMSTTRHHADSTYDEQQILGGIIVQAAQGKKAIPAIKQAFRSEGYTISDGQAKSIIKLLDHAAQIPTEYFEAKPQRVVNFGEAAAVVAPDNAPQDLIRDMRAAGMNVVEYAAGDEASRLKAINRLEGVRFSVSDDEGTEKKRERAIIAQQELHRALGTMFSIPAGTKAEMNAIIDAFAAKAVRDGSLTQEDMTALFDRLYNSGVMEVAADEYRQAARSAVERKRIFVPESVKREFGDDWNGFRQQAFGAGVYLTNSETDYGIDVLNGELSESLPGIFDPDETDMRLILERVVQAAEEGKAQRMSLAEYTAMLAEQEYVSESEVLDTLERQLDWAMRTFAEKARIEVTLRERADSKRASERIRKAREREAGKVRRERERGWENSRRQRERELESRAKERAKRREIIERQRKQKELRELQQKTLKQLQWLSKNRYRAPAELQKAFDDVLSDIDIYAAGAADSARLSKKYGMTWQELADIYKEAKENDKNFFPSKELEQIVARLDNRKIKDMDIDALTDLYKAAVGLRTELYNRNNVIMDELHRTFAEIYTDSKAEIKSADLDNGKTKLFNSMQLSPMNMLQRAAGWNPDSTFYSMAKQLEKGERDIRAYTVKAERMLEDFLNEHREWVERADGQGKDAIWYELTVPELLELKMGDKPIFGETFEVYMTPSQKVHMYLESKNYENLRHMAGGRTFPDKELYSRGKRREAFEKGRTIKLAPETVKSIVSSLTPEEMELANVLERYYNDFAKGEINRVSNALYGYDKAVSKNYAPIYTNKSYVQSTPGVYNATAEGVGNLKAREYSKNPSYNIGAFDAFEKHIEQTARFVGMAIPARNWTTLMNWGDGSTSMRDTINHRWTNGAKYIDDLLAELQGNGGVQKDEISTFADKVFGNYIGAVFGANPSIVFKQLGSIPLGGVWLGFNNLPSPAQVKRIDTKLIARYTQELAWRTLGYAMPETKFLKEHPNWTQTNKFTRFAFGGGAITAMDGWAASVLWPWAENKVRKEHPELSLGTQEEIDSGASPFYREVAKVFDEAVARSQSTSDIMHQGTLRRSKNDVARAFTMFKSDSSQSFNALRQRLGEAKYYKKTGDKKKYREALGGLAAALLAVLGGNLWAEAVNFLMNLWKHGGKSYRDDDWELTPGSVAGEMTVGLIGDMAGLTAGGEELVDWLDGVIENGVWSIPRIEVFGLEQINDFTETVLKNGNSGIDALKEAANIVKNGGSPLEYLRRHGNDLLGGIKDIGKLAATYFPSLPVNNLEAYMLGTVRWISPELAAAYEDVFATANKNRLKGLKGNALAERVGSIFDVRGVDASEDASREAARLYEAGYAKAVPADTPDKISVENEERKLSAYQKQVYDQVWAGSVGDALGELVQLEDYQNADDAEREKMFKAVYDYAADKAKAVVFEDYTPKETAEGADAVIAAGGSAALWGAWKGMSAGLEKGEQKYELLKSLGYTDKVKLAIAGSLMGTEMETDSGAPSQYAKMLEAVKLGLDMDSYIELHQAEAVDRFLDAAEAGANVETAKNAALGLAALEPEEGKKTVSDKQKWRAAVDAGGTTEDQMNALKAVMTESHYGKLEIALSYGIEPESYVHLKEIMPDYDADGTGSLSGDELKKAIDSMGGNDLPSVGSLTREQQAVLWQLYSSAKSASNNPYNIAVGRKVLEAKNKKKEEEKNRKKD